MKFITFVALIVCACKTLFAAQLTKIKDIQLNEYSGNFYQTEITGSHIFTATTQGLVIIEKDNTGQSNILPLPHEIPELQPYTSGQPALAVEGTVAFAATGYTGVFAIDISSPENPVVISTIPTEKPVKSLSVQSGYLLIYESHGCIDNCGSYIEVIDISNPNNPQKTEFVLSGNPKNGPLMDAAFTESYLIKTFYSFGWGIGRYELYDRNDLSQPLRAWEEKSDSVYFMDIICATDDYAYIQSSFRWLSVIDLAGENDGFHGVEEIEAGGNFIPRSVQYDEKLILTWANKNTFFSYDISNPIHPVLLDTQEILFPSSTVDIDVLDGKLLLTLRDVGLVSYDLSGKDAGELLYVPAYAKNVVYADNYLYATRDYGVTVYDISDFDTIQTVNQTLIQGRSNAILHYEDHLYIPGVWDGLGIIDCLNPSDLKYKNTDPFPGGIYYGSMIIHDGFAYCAGDYLYGVLDITDPWNPEPVYFNSFSSFNKIIGVNGKYAIIFSKNEVKVFDNSNVTEPEYISTIPNIGKASFGFGSTIYTSEISELLTAIDITDPLNPVYLTTDIHLDPLKDVHVEDKFLFISDGDLHIFDITNPLEPQSLVSFDTGRQTGTLDVELPYIYTADGQFIRIYQFDGGTSVSQHNRPVAMDIIGNHPNPFNPSTTITFTLPKTGYLILTVYDITGRKVSTLVDGMTSPGKHEVVFDGSDSSSGVYFYRLKVNGLTKTGKMLLLK